MGICSFCNAPDGDGVRPELNNAVIVLNSKQDIGSSILKTSLYSNKFWWMVHNQDFDAVL
jgi:hypothetical protein